MENEEMTNDAAVAWQWLDTSNFRKNIPPAAVREHWNPLYSATTVAELRAEVERKSILIEQFMDKWAEEVRRADAAERRVAELEGALKVADSLIDPDMGVCPMGRKEASDMIRAALTKESP